MKFNIDKEVLSYLIDKKQDVISVKMIRKGSG